MIHIALFGSLFSLCAGAVSLTVSMLFFLRYRKRVIVWYSLLLGTVILLALSRMIELYCRIAGIEQTTFGRLLPTIIEKAGYLLGLISGTRFCFCLIGIQLKKWMHLLIVGISVLYTAATFAELLNTTSGYQFIRLGVGLPILFGTYIALCIITALKLDSIAERQLRMTVKLFFTLSILVLPLSLVKYFRDLPYLPWHLENSIVLIVIAVGSIMFAFRFFNRPSYLVQGRISEYFRSRFGTTDREEEIVLCTVQGLSNNEIGQKLCISVRTVESHLYKVFQKTGVKNRIQLINLLSSDSAD
ncbi:MAG: helix-turn-helix transcriptional regulator [Chitinispirillaceae bacterium]|nr:helix-turn-helix transcriptional regulator [Chitinispirillaceae bacterium]